MPKIANPTISKSQEIQNLKRQVRNIRDTLAQALNENLQLREQLKERLKNRTP